MRWGNWCDAEQAFRVLEDPSKTRLPDRQPAWRSLTFSLLEDIHPLSLPGMAPFSRLTKLCLAVSQPVTISFTLRDVALLVLPQPLALSPAKTRLFNTVITWPDRTTCTKLKPMLTSHLLPLVVAGCFSCAPAWSVQVKLRTRFITDNFYYGRFEYRYSRYYSVF